MAGTENKSNGETAPQAKAPEAKPPEAKPLVVKPAEAGIAEGFTSDDRAVLAAWAYLRSHWKEIAVLTGSAITTLVGAVIWVVAYFATQEQVTRIECILSTNISIQSLPLELALIKYQLDESMVEASTLEDRLKKTKYTPEDQKMYARVSSERKRLESRQDRAEKELQDARARQLECIKGSRTTEKKQP
ncbi:hypothetical protein AB7M16_000757 [Bradyrhizobium sp. USDA 372]